MTEETIFAAALTKKTAGERTAFLDQACAGRPQLRAAVEELLKADSDAGSFLDRPPAALNATIVATAASRETLNSTAWINRLSFLTPSDKPDRLGKLVSKVGEYEIMEVVGHGGMGAVLRALDTKLSRVVAVKVMAPELAANPAAVRRFLREAQAGAAIHHDHVVTIHAVDESHEPPFIVMQFVEGQTLQDKIDREGPLSPKQILRIGSQAAAGLAAAHKMGHIHRDVKPANILLENGVERVKISDFGLARAADDLQVTQTGIIAGTPQYMSPEQAKGEPIDARSDLFSLGSVLYTMCTGRPAFRADNPVAVLRRVCDDQPRPIRELNAEIPDWLCEIVEKLLSKVPQQRFASAQEVADILAQCLAHLQQPASCPLPPRVISRPARAPAGANEIIGKEARWLWAAGIMSVVAAALAIVGFQKSSSLPSLLATWFIVGGILSLPVGLTIMYAAWQVESRQSYCWALTGAWLAFLPINPFLIFCLPITIWSLVTILQAKPTSRLAFEQKPPRPSPGHLIIEQPVLGLVAILMLLTAVGAATFMLTAAAYRRLRSPPSQNSLANQMASVIRATKDQLSRSEWLRLSVENPSLAGQLGEPTTKALLEFLADLPESTRRELLEQGYVKWPVSALPPPGQAAIAAFESSLKSEPAGSYRNAAALKQAHTGFAVVDLPRKKQQVISWFLIWPKEQHEWVTVVNTKALDNHPSYFAAHNERLNGLRNQRDSEAAATEPPGN